MSTPDLAPSPLKANAELSKTAAGRPKRGKKGHSDGRRSKRGKQMGLGQGAAQTGGTHCFGKRAVQTSRH
eukprot:1456438-Pyramimonas_sp.AAC.1